MTNGLLPVPRISFCRPLNGFELLENGEMQFPNGSSAPYQPHLRPYAKDLYKTRHEAAQATACASSLLSLNKASSGPRKALLETPPLNLTGM